MAAASRSHRNELGFGRLCVVDVDRASPPRARPGRPSTWPRAGTSRSPGAASTLGGRAERRQDADAAGHLRHDVVAADASSPTGRWRAGQPTLDEPELVTLGRSPTVPTVHGRLYRPRRARDRGRLAPAPAGLDARRAHRQWPVAFQARIAYFVAGGWAVLVTDHRGSTGHGRAYTMAMRERWGDLDVVDTAGRGAARRSSEGWCDRRRIVAIGASSGGFTTYHLLAREPELFAAGVSLYGVADLLHLDETSHRFERHYLHTIVGPLPAAVDRYRERSPVNLAERITAPLLVLQGSDDDVVPPVQSQAIVDRLRGLGRDGGAPRLRRRGARVVEARDRDRRARAHRRLPPAPCPTVAAVSTRICPVCGSDYLDWVETCSTCGVPLVVPAQAPDPLRLPGRPAGRLRARRVAPRDAGVGRPGDGRVGHPARLGRHRPRRPARPRGDASTRCSKRSRPSGPGSSAPTGSTRTRRRLTPPPRAPAGRAPRSPPRSRPSGTRPARMSAATARKTVATRTAATSWSTSSTSGPTTTGPSCLAGWPRPASRTAGRTTTVLVVRRPRRGPAWRSSSTSSSSPTPWRRRTQRRGQDETSFELMSELFVAADRLKGNPRDPDGIAGPGHGRRGGRPGPPAVRGGAGAVAAGGRGGQRSRRPARREAATTTATASPTTWSTRRASPSTPTTTWWPGPGPCGTCCARSSEREPPSGAEAHRLRVVGEGPGPVGSP